MFAARPLKLVASAVAGSSAELFLAEGDSAASAISAVRNASFQAVLPMQGKPLNPIRASEAKVRAFAWYAELLKALGGETAPNFGRLILLFDPDADGIHCSALTLMFCHRFLPTVLAEGRIEMARAPMFALQAIDSAGVLGETQHAWTDADCERMRAALIAAGAVRVMVRRHRGLGAIDSALLARDCVDPKTRRTTVMSAADAQAAINVFGGGATDHG